MYSGLTQQMMQTRSAELERAAREHLRTAEGAQPSDPASVAPAWRSRFARLARTRLRGARGTSIVRVSAGSSSSQAQRHTS